jgi:sugar phosphate isomerase/epimerase
LSRFDPAPGSIPRLAFSTLACPEWTPSEVVDAAARFGYDAIEWRGGDDGHVRTSWSRRQRQLLRDEMADRGIEALCVTAYTSFVSPDPGARARDREHLERHLELARDLGAPFVRAFIGIREDAAPISDLRRRAADELAVVAESARDAAVRIGLEQHDDFDRASEVGELLKLLPDPSIGAIWDVANGWVAGETPAAGFAGLADRLFYAQLKDLRGTRERWHATRFGEGTVPLEDAIAILGRHGDVPLCVEWIRAWDPALDPPATALPAMREFVLAAIGEVPGPPSGRSRQGAGG